MQSKVHVYTRKAMKLFGKAQAQLVATTNYISLDVFLDKEKDSERGV